MKWLLLCAGLTACAFIQSDPDDGGGDDGSGTGTKAEVCREARDCTAADNGCASYPYEQLPDRCVSICYEGRCCANYEGAWHLVIYDCAHPIVDAGIDAPPPDA